LVIAPPFNLDLLGKLWGVIDQHRINTFSSVPTMIRLLIQYAQHRSEKIPDSLKFVTCASAPIASSEVALFEKIFKTPLLNCYGLTETCGWSTCSPNRADRSLSAVGMPINGEIRIIDDNGNVLPPGEKGQLQIKGPSVMQGYFLNAELSNQILNDGWLSTGDIGEINERGEVFILSRIKDMIIRAGKNIYPAEVDQVLMSHPDVVEAYTVGLDDNLLGEKVAACVVLKKHASLNEVELIAFTQQMLADYKCPQKIIFLDSVPKTSRGKVNRSQLKVFFEVECL
jgi:long-chain acyl-CoA synthetase